MVQLAPAGPNETNAIETFARLSIQNSPTKINQPTNAQPMTHSHNNNNNNNTLLPHSQSNTVLLQFCLMMEELKNFTKQVSNNITEMTQAHSTTQEHTGKLIEHAISKALAKNTGYNCTTTQHNKQNTRNITYASPTYDLHQMLIWPPNQQAMLFTPHVDSHQTYNHQSPKQTHILIALNTRYIRHPQTSTGQWLLS